MSLRHSVLATLLLAFAFNASVEAQISNNVSLFGGFTPVPFRYSGSWGYTSPGGQEYAILGGNPGTYIISIDDSTNIHQVGFIAGPSSNWREIVVVGDHAFVVTEGTGTGAGMQVIDLSNLPTSATLVATYSATFTRGHIISRDIYTDSGYVFVNGTSTTGGVHILDVSNPATPVQVGIYDPTYYIHDSHIRGYRMYASALGQGLDIVDISDKTNPTFIRRITYPSRFTHSCWTTDDNRFLFITDEVDGLPARIWNIEDLNNIHEVAQYSGNLQSLVHNPYILGDFAFVSHNTEGLRVVDIADASVPVEVGYYDTYSGPSGGFNGLWSAYPYLSSGKILGGDRQLGLRVWRFNQTRAGRVYGIVTDSVSGEPITSAQVTIVQTGRSSLTDSSGLYKLGELPGSPSGYTISVAASDFVSKSIPGVVLSGGDSMWLSVQLVPIQTSVESPRSTTDGYLLLQNYPNPFNPSTRIKYQIPRQTDGGQATQSHVTMKVYDLLGREVATLVNEEKAAGTYDVSFDGSGLSSGIYLYRLQAGAFGQIRKLMLLR